MTTEEYLEMMKGRPYLTAGSEAHACMHVAAEEARRLTCLINDSFHTQEEIRALFSRLIGQELDDGFGLFPPIYTDFGRNIRIGKGVFINAGCCFQDQGGIEIGDGCLIGHQVVFATLNHDPIPSRRANMIPAPIRLGKGVWVGSHATILGGVLIGDHAIVGAGAVVNRDVPADTVVGGVPARVIRRIGEREERPCL